MSEAKPAVSDAAIAAFISKWAKVTASESATSQPFLGELCDLLAVERPTATEDYQFERPVVFVQPDGKQTTKFIDLYKRGCFVLESKKYDSRTVENPELALALETADAKPAKKSKITRGTGQWDDAMLKAYKQASDYAHNLSTDEPNPVFLLVVDVGHTIELYSDFSQKGKAYVAFPDARSHRIPLADLAKPAVRDLLRAVWLDPQSLDPSRRTLAVTLTVASHLAALAQSFKKAGEPAKLVAEFLTRCLFCMFAEDVGLLPKDSFRMLLEEIKDPRQFVPLISQLFKEMDSGTGSAISLVLRHKLLRFNGGLFSDPRVLEVNGTQLGLLREAARCEWRHVEPAIFGTLLEQALSARERGSLGAHFTPRAYVERLVLPTVIEPLRADWNTARDEAVLLANRGNLPAARARISDFHQKLCAIRVLDPACGSGNFLYVTLEHMKRIEGDALDLLRSFGDRTPPAVTVDPHQFLGLELNPQAVPIAELVLWIGYLQWHFRVHGEVLPAEPVLKNFANIQETDAVLAYDGQPVPITGKMAAANPNLPGLPGNWRDLVEKHTDTIFAWDRRSTKIDSATGRAVPDVKQRVLLYAYRNPRPTLWPTADFIVGNPPFIGTKRMRDALGDGYVATLRDVYGDVVEDNADFVMYWWHKAAELARAGKVRRFGLITTNSLKQSFNRRIVSHHLSATPPLSLLFAIPDHPWVDPSEADVAKAAVRVAMTVGAQGECDGELQTVLNEQPQDDGSVIVTLSPATGRIQADLTIGAKHSAINALQANDGIGGLGVALHGSGFILEPDAAASLRKTGSSVIKPYLGGSDLLHIARERYLIDFSFMSEDEARSINPPAFNHVTATVRPERIVNRRDSIRKLWWRFGWERPEIRKAMSGLTRYIATTETAKHRVFQFLDGAILPDHMVIVIASDDAFHLGVLSSRIHVVYALAAGGTLEDRPRYNKSRCFDPFPFPDCTEKQKSRVRKLAEELDAHRKRVQAQNGLGLTDIYNVLEKLRAGEPLNAKDKIIHDHALVATLRQLHDDLDAAVADAYGWPWPLADADILSRVVELNTARAAEEKAGSIRWLRPEYQAKGELLLEGGGAHAENPPAPARKPAGKEPWPTALPDRIKAVESVLSYAERPQTILEITQRFSRVKEASVAEIIETLVSLGRARPGDQPGTFVR